MADKKNGFSSYQQEKPHVPKTQKRNKQMLAENDSTNKSAKYFADWAGDFAEWQISPDDIDEAERDADFTRDDDAADFDAARWPEFLNV